MSHAFPERLQVYLVQSVADLTLGREPAVLPGLGEDEVNEDWPLAVIGLASADVDASLVLACPPGFITATHPNPSAVTSDAKLHDWLGEMANLTAGRLKQLVHAHGVKLKVRPPSIELSGAGTILARIRDRAPSQDFWFKCGEHPLFVLLSAELGPQVDFDGDPDPLLVSPQAGDILV